MIIESWKCPKFKSSCVVLKSIRERDFWICTNALTGVDFHSARRIFSCSAFQHIQSSKINTPVVRSLRTNQFCVNINIRDTKNIACFTTACLFRNGLLPTIKYYTYRYPLHFNIKTMMAIKWINLYNYYPSKHTKIHEYAYITSSSISVQWQHVLVLLYIELSHRVK